MYLSLSSSAKGDSLGGSLALQRFSVPSQPRSLACTKLPSRRLLSDVPEQAFNLRPHLIARPQSIYKMSTRSETVQSVQCFGKKKTATAVAHCRQGKGLIKVNGKPLNLVEPQILRFKVYEPLLILGLDKFGMWTLKMKAIA